VARRDRARPSSAALHFDVCTGSLVTCGSTARASRTP
jgi:hypothetical protein